MQRPTPPVEQGPTQRPAPAVPAAPGARRAGRARASLSVCALVAIGCASIGQSIQRWIDGEEPSPPPPAVELGAEYLVKPGDTLREVAAWHGVPIEEVAVPNDLPPDAPLEPGLRLRLPRHPLATHEVRRGDTIGALAAWFGTETEAMIHLNDITNVRRVRVGKVLRIPATARRTDAPPRVAAARPPRAPAPPPAARQTPAAAPGAAPETSPETPGVEVDAALAAAAAAFDAADFDATLAAATRARDRLPDRPTADADRQRRVRALVLTGMAQVALAREDEARATFRDALATDPELELDAERVSPKIVETFEAVRADALAP